MPFYEVVMLAQAGPKVTPRLTGFLKDMTKQLWSSGAVIADLKSWGSRPLAYRIRKSQENHYHAHYLGLHVFCSPKALVALEGVLPCHRRSAPSTVWPTSSAAAQQNCGLRTSSSGS